MKKIYKVTLTADERAFLMKLVSTGKSSAQTIKHANILLAVDETESNNYRASGVSALVLPFFVIIIILPPLGVFFHEICYGTESLIPATV